MIVIKLKGGLGNQMFQYAFGRQVAELARDELFLDRSYFRKNGLRRLIKNTLKMGLALLFLRPGQAWQEIRRNRRQYDLGCFELDNRTKESEFPKLRTIEEGRAFIFDSSLFNHSGDRAYDGYFNSEKYFSAIASAIRADFRLKPEYRRSLPAGLLDQINGANSVSLHVRRGDYITRASTNRYHGACHPDYYRRAIEEMEKRVSDPKWFIFSDDIEWCRKNLPLPPSAIFVSGLKNYADLALMSLCRHHVIANSTFSWWGAWLNPNPDKIVIAPRHWLNDQNIKTTDLLPSAWLKI
jgi:hypothetical protein